MIELMPERQTLLMVVDGTVIGMPAVDRGLAGGHLTGAGQEHLAHEHVVDLLAGEPGPLEGGLDGEAAEVWSRRSRRASPATCRSACVPPPG